MISRRPQCAVLQNWGVRGTKAAWIKVQALVTQPDWDAKRWNSWESKENKEKMLPWPCAIGFLIQRKTKAQQHPPQSAG